MSRTTTVARFEFRMQASEFLSGIYVAVFFLLTATFTSSHVLELVSNRAGIPKNAPLILAEAMAGITAFGAVITTMIASSAVMRDVALRTEALVLTTRLTAREYLLGRFVGALGLMLLVYAAIPLGLVVGTTMPWASRGDLVPFSISAYARPMALLVLPNVLLVSAIFFSVGALARSFFAILLTGVGLVTLWQLGLSFGEAPGTALFGALLDPFGNAALAHAIRDIVGTARGTATLPFAEALLVNRALWLSLGATALLVTIRRFRFALAPVTGSDAAVARKVRSPNKQTARAQQPTVHAHVRPLVRGASWGRQAWTGAQVTFMSTISEKGFVALAVLALLNGANNAWAASAPTVHVTNADSLRAVVEHTRLFFILIATIWAGELVCRERDLRIDGLYDCLPVRMSATVVGKLIGVHAAQATLVALLGVMAFLLPRLQGVAHVPTATLTIGWFAMAMFPAVMLLTQLSLAVHAIVQNKVAGHVLCIAGWVAAVAIGASGGESEILTIHDMPAVSAPIGGRVNIDWVAQARDVAFDVIRGGACTLLAIAAWSRGARSARWRWRTAQGTPVVP